MDDLRKSEWAVYTSDGHLLEGLTAARERKAMERQAQNYGVGLGELIRALTDSVGIEQCGRCERWQRTLDAWLRIGRDKIPWAEILEKVDSLRKPPPKITITWL